MKIAIVLCLLFVAFETVSSEFGAPAETCSDDECKDKCRCASNKRPLSNLPLDQVPQLVSLTFDGALTDDAVDNYWSDLILELDNPDGSPIGGTFFIPHEYTSYTRVNDFYNYGFEIAVHSITENNLQTYWRYSDLDTLQKEFGGQKTIISRFANIPQDQIIGVRAPQLQLAGNTSIKAYIAAGLQYDSSWPTTPLKPLFPYTLDYLSTQECTLGDECPNESFPGFWILPINDLNGKGGYCNTLASCRLEGTADQIAEWLNNELESRRTSTKIPLTLIINPSWFTSTDNSYDGLKKFLDGLKAKKDVFLVSQKQVLNWIKNPIPLKDFKTDGLPPGANCMKVRCKLDKNGVNRYMDSCVSCPEVYPWLGNPNGEKKRVE